MRCRPTLVLACLVVLLLFCTQWAPIPGTPQRRSPPPRPQPPRSDPLTSAEPPAQTPLPAPAADAALSPGASSTPGPVQSATDGPKTGGLLDPQGDALKPPAGQRPVETHQPRPTTRAAPIEDRDADAPRVSCKAPLVDSRKYLLYKSEGCPGLLHKLASLACAAAEARRLDRTLILDPICVSPLHNRNITGPSGQGALMLVSDLLDLRDAPHLLWGCDTGRFLERAAAVKGPQPSAKIARMRDKFVVRSGFSQRRGFWWYTVCRRFDPAPAQFPWSPRVQHAAKEVARALGPFVFVHVRRGDMIERWRICWPRLDEDTRAEAIAVKLGKWLPAVRTLYVATNEWRPGFFAPMRRAFRPFLAADFADDALAFTSGNNYLLFAVEKALSTHAVAVVETFREVAEAAGTPYYLARDLRNPAACGMAEANTTAEANK